MLDYKTCLFQQTTVIFKRALSFARDNTHAPRIQFVGQHHRQTTIGNGYTLCFKFITWPLRLGFDELYFTYVYTCDTTTHPCSEHCRNTGGRSTAREKFCFNSVARAKKLRGLIVYEISVYRFGAIKCIIHP